MRLRNPWVDKPLAIVAVAPFAYGLYSSRAYFSFAIPYLCYFFTTLVLVGTMLWRKAPVRVTSNPWYWLLTLVATYWAFLPLIFQNDGRALVSPGWYDAISLLGCAINVWGRFSLGRSIGFVPSQRDIVVRGAYRFMRHPIYTGVSITGIGYALAYYSPRNALFVFFLIFWFAVKSLAEESFLRQDPAYAAYMAQVRWRWFPGLA